MTLFVVLMCVNLTSCEKDEINRPQYELITSGKKITKIEISNSYIGHSLYSFNYDDAGRLLEVICSNGNNTYKYNYTWSNNIIKGSSYNTYALIDGFISKYNDNKEVIYSGQQRAYKIKSLSSYDYDYTFIWDSNSGGLGRRDIHYREENRSSAEESFRFIYDEKVKTCNNFNPIFPILLSDAFDGDLLCVAHPELVGARVTQLPNRFTKENFWIDGNGRRDSETIHGTCNYKFDSDGYLTECIMNENSTDYYSYKAKYTITWE